MRRMSTHAAAFSFLLMVLFGCDPSALGSGECGDGEVSLLEECDDGNTDDGDECTSMCRNAFAETGLYFGVKKNVMTRTLLMATVVPIAAA